MKDSIVFSPTTDDRALDREVEKIDSELQTAGQIQPELGDVDTSGLGLDGADTGISAGGGGVGVGAAAGAGGVSGLASKIPKPVAGVSFAAALPVALGGAVGVGMLNAMRGASARLQTSSTILGQAWNNVWRPIGDEVDQLFVRDMVKETRDATLDFEETWRSGNRWEAVANLLGDLETGPTPIDAAKMGAEAGAELRGVFEDPDWPDIGAADIIGGIGWPTIGAGAAIAAINWPTIGASVLLNPITWPTVGAGAIVGAVGWPTLNAQDVLDALTGDSKDKTTTTTTSTTTTGPTGSTDPEGGDLRLQRKADQLNRKFRAGVGGAGGRRSGPVTGLQRGGLVRRETTARVGEAGPEVVQPLSEFRRMMESMMQNAGGGGGGLSRQDARDLKQGIRDVNRNIKSLARTLGDMSLEVDGETFGRVSRDTRQNRVVDTDPSV